MYVFIKKSHKIVIMEIEIILVLFVLLKIAQPYSK